MCQQLRTPGKRTRPLWRIRAAEERGAELVEAALVLPLLLMLLIGIVWMGRAYNMYETISHAAREGARFAVAPSCALCGNSYPSDDEVRSVVNRALTASSLNPAAVQPSPIEVQRNVVLNPGSSPTETGVVIGFRYPLLLVVPFTSVHLTSMSISTQVRMREEK